MIRLTLVLLTCLCLPNSLHGQDLIVYGETVHTMAGDAIKDG